MRVATVSRADPAPIQRVLGPPREKAREVGSEESLFGASACQPACWSGCGLDVREGIYFDRLDFLIFFPSVHTALGEKKYSKNHRRFKPE